MNTNTLIPIFAGELSGMPVQLVDARLLHTFLESAQDFSDWVKKRIKAYGFIENTDYLLHKFMEQLPSGAKHKMVGRGYLTTPNRFGILMRLS